MNEQKYNWYVVLSATLNFSNSNKPHINIDLPTHCLD